MQVPSLHYKLYVLGMYVHKYIFAYPSSLTPQYLIFFARKSQDQW